MAKTPSPYLYGGNTAPTTVKPTASKPIAPPPPLGPYKPPFSGYGYAPPDERGPPKSPISLSPTVPADTGGGGGGGDGGGDYSASDVAGLLGIYGLPADVAAQVMRYLQSGDPNAILLARNYVRGTSWYAATFPGALEAMRMGIVQDETDYQRQLTQANQYYQQYMGRNVGGDEFGNYLKQGYNSTVIGQKVGGQAYIRNYGSDLSYVTGAFDTTMANPGELAAYGEQQMGFGSQLGIQLQRRIDAAQQRLKAVFGGSAGGTSLALGKAGLSAPSLVSPQQTPSLPS